MDAACSVHAPLPRQGSSSQLLRDASITTCTLGPLLSKVHAQVSQGCAQGQVETALTKPDRRGFPGTQHPGAGPHGGCRIGGWGSVTGGLSGLRSHVGGDPASVPRDDSLRHDLHRKTAYLTFKTKAEKPFIKVVRQEASPSSGGRSRMEAALLRSPPAGLSGRGTHSPPPPPTGLPRDSKEPGSAIHTNPEGVPLPLGAEWAQISRTGTATLLVPEDAQKEGVPGARTQV